MFTDMKNFLDRLVSRQDMFDKRIFELENTTETSKTANKGEEKLKKKKKERNKRYRRILGTTTNRQKGNCQSHRKYLETKQPTKD